MLIGGIASSLTVYSERLLAETQPNYPAELKQKLDPHLPSNGELITGIAPPLVLWAVSKKKPKLKPIAFGSMLYSAPELTRRIVQNTAYAEGLAARPAARFVAPTNMTRYSATPYAPVVMQPSLGKYVVTS